MSFRISSTLLASLFLLATTPVYATGSKASAAQRFGTRPVAGCPVVKAKASGPPPKSALKALVRCNFEANWGNQIILMDNIKVEVGNPIPWSPDIMAADADSRFPFYPIRGSFREVNCQREFSWSKDKGRNCSIQHITHDEGLCWHTGFGDWKCGFGGTNMTAEPPVKHQAPPADLAAP